jgi:A/G-specific adenine glycosylase
MKAKQLQDLADSLVPLGMSWEWNQVLMELGGRVCTARSPRCGQCPVRQWCVFRSRDLAIDPATLSAGASKPQPRFEGSDRQLRGAVLRIVLDSAQRLGPQDIADIHIHFSQEVERVRVEKIISDLVREGLLLHIDNKICAP